MLTQTKRLVGWISSLGIGILLSFLAELSFLFFFTYIILGGILSALSTISTEASFPYWAVFTLGISSLTMLFSAYFLSGFRFGFNFSKSPWEDVAFAAFLYLLLIFSFKTLSPFFLPKIINLNELSKIKAHSISAQIESLFWFLFPFIIILEGVIDGRKRKNKSETGKAHKIKIAAASLFLGSLVLYLILFFIFYNYTSTYREPPSKYFLESSSRVEKYNFHPHEPRICKRRFSKPL
jgi:hypothetical protein